MTKFRNDYPESDSEMPTCPHCRGWWLGNRRSHYRKNKTELIIKCAGCRKKFYRIVEEGFEFCDLCGGVGSRRNMKGFNWTCTKCGGYGKLDWVQNILLSNSYRT